MLAWEMLDSILLLVCAGKRRTAFALSRPMIGYATRLQYYTIEGTPNKYAWLASGEFGPAGSRIRDTMAFRDLHNAAEKMFINLRTMQVDLSVVNDQKTRTLFQSKLDSATEYTIQKWFRMLDAAEGKRGSGVRRDMIDAEYGFTGAYLHGDQLASFEIFNLWEEGNLSSRFSDKRVVSVACTFAVELMGAVGRACGRKYGFWYFLPKLHEILD